MGWLFVNIVLPISLPLIFLLLARLVELDAPTRARAKLIRAVQDGQLSWIAMGFAASTTYELFEALADGQTRPTERVGLAFAMSILILGSAGFIATLGTLYPVDNSLGPAKTTREWVRRYRLFLVSAVATIFTGYLYTLVHLSVPIAVK